MKIIGEHLIITEKHVKLYPVYFGVKRLNEQQETLIKPQHSGTDRQPDVTKSGFLVPQ